MRAVVTALFFLASLGLGSASFAQTKPAADKSAATAPATATAQTPEELNLREYVLLLRKDVNAQKAQIVGQVMQFDAEDSAKFWPIYRDYEAELNKLNDQRVANIREYANSYSNMTDDKADELIKNAMNFQKQRNELLGKYYEKVRQELGGITAARFMQVEHQLLLIIDLKIASALPVVGS
jgi:hypothetical protein